MTYLVRNFSLENLKYPESGKLVAVISEEDSYKIQNILKAVNEISISSILLENNNEKLISLGIDLESLHFDSSEEVNMEIGYGDTIVYIPDNKPPFSIRLL